jgi:hypothetical protein
MEPKLAFVNEFVITEYQQEGPCWIPVSLFKVARGCQSMVMPGDQVLQEL